MKRLLALLLLCSTPALAQNIPEPKSGRVVVLNHEEVLSVQGSITSYDGDCVISMQEVSVRNCILTGVSK